MDILEAILHDTTYPPEEGYPVADVSAIAAATELVISLLDQTGTQIVPYFDVTPDNGVNCYFDSDTQELEVHVPPAGSKNYYCFFRLVTEDGIIHRKVERQPTMERLIELLHKVEGVPNV